MKDVTQSDRNHIFFGHFSFLVGTLSQYNSSFSITFLPIIRMYFLSCAKYFLSIITLNYKEYERRDLN